MIRLTPCLSTSTTAFTSLQLHEVTLGLPSRSTFLFCSKQSAILFLGANYYFAKKQTEWKTYEIVRKTEINGAKHNRSITHPAVIIMTENNDTKRIDFARNLKNKVDFSNSLELTLSKGLFNFYIIRNKELK